MLLPSLCLLIRTFYNSSKKMSRNLLLERCLHFFYKNTLYTNSEAYITQKLRIIEEQ